MLFLRVCVLNVSLNGSRLIRSSSRIVSWSICFYVSIKIKNRNCLSVPVSVCLSVDVVLDSRSIFHPQIGLFSSFFLLLLLSLIWCYVSPNSLTTHRLPSSFQLFHSSSILFQQNFIIWNGFIFSSISLYASSSYFLFSFRYLDKGHSYHFLIIFLFNLFHLTYSHNDDIGNIEI